MLVLLSPAKKLASAPEVAKDIKISTPSLINMTEVLLGRMKSYSEVELSELMGISAKLSSLNFGRYQNFESLAQTPAIYLFRGDTYSGFDVDNLGLESLEFANSHIRILSGLYGILRPYDNIREYRLEMGTKFKNGESSLYQYWRKNVTLNIIEALSVYQESMFIVNLASREYSEVVDRKELQDRGIDWLDFVFYDTTNSGESKVVGLLAKKARGRFARVISDHKLDTLAKLDYLKRSDIDGYCYKVDASSESKWVFSRS